MKQIKTYTALQLSTLVVLRFLAGWHLLYEGLSKLLNPGWSSAGFLSESKWLLSSFSEWIISNGGVLNTIDFLNTWGLIAIGTGLILGLFARTAAVAGTLLLLMYYLINPPLIGLEYSLPVEGNYLIVNKISIIPDQNSTHYKKQLNEGIINYSEPMLTLNPNSGKIDALTSATERYYSSRGLTTANINGKQVDITHLHLKEWLNCIRTGETACVNIESAFEEGITIIMAQKSYLEKRQVGWDPEKRKII